MHKLVGFVIAGTILAATTVASATLTAGTTASNSTGAQSNAACRFEPAELTVLTAHLPPEQESFITPMPSSSEIAQMLEAVSKILAEQDEETAKMHEAEIVGGMIFIADHQPPEVA